MDSVQIEEFSLTIAQTLFGIALLLGLRLGIRASIGLFVLFLSTLVFPAPEVRMWVAVLYFVMAIPIILFRYRDLGRALSEPFRTSK
jgi:cation:H+ antiporter